MHRDGVETPPSRTRRLVLDVLQAGVADARAKSAGTTPASDRAVQVPYVAPWARDRVGAVKMPTDTTRSLPLESRLTLTSASVRLG